MNSLELPGNFPSPAEQRGGDEKHQFRFLETGTLEGRNMSLPGLLDALWRWRRLTAGLLALSLISTITYLFVATREYTATASLLIETRKPKIVSSLDVLPGIGGDASLIDSQLELLRSPLTARRVIERLNLDSKLRLPMEQDKSGAAAGSEKVVSAANAVATDNDNVEKVISQETIERFIKRVSVQRKGLTYIVLVHYTDEDRDTAAKIANAVANSYIRYQLEIKSDATERANTWLDGRITDLRGELRKSEEGIQAFKRKYNLTSVGGMTLAERELADTAQRLAEAREKASNARARVDQIKRMATQPDSLTGLGEALKSEVITDLRRQYSKVNRQVASLSTQFGPTHQRTLAMSAELKDINQQIHAELDRLVQNASNDHEVALRRKNLLEIRLDQLHEAFAKRETITVSLAELERQAEAYRKLYLSYLTRSKETKSQVSLQTPDARLITKATPPRRASAPRPGLMLAIALAGALGLGLSISLFLSQIHQPVRNLGDVRQIMRTPHLVSLPTLSPKGFMAWLANWVRQRRIAKENPPQNPMPSVSRSNRKWQHARHVLGNPVSDFTQQVFAITNVLEPLKREFNAQVVAVVSSSSGEGKTTVALNLAEYLAISDHRTLLIDCDLRTNDLTRMLGASSNETLVDYIEGQVSADELITRQEESGLYFCPGSGEEAPARPMNVLASPKFNELIESQRTNFDYIILDTAALGPFVDTQSLTQNTDVLLWVMEWDRTTADDVANAVDRARVREDQLLISVLNKSSGW